MMKKQNRNIEIVDSNLFFDHDGLRYSVNLRNVSTKLSEIPHALFNRYQLSPSGYGIHWPELNEDLSFEGLLPYARKEHQAGA